MKKNLILGALTLSFVLPAHAWTYVWFGNTCYHNLGDGVVATVSMIGSQTPNESNCAARINKNEIISAQKQIQKAISGGKLVQEKLSLNVR